MNIESDKSCSQIQKTSITINNDECSSTVNVSERISLYHSSVLIKDSSHQTENVNRQKPFEKLEKKDQSSKRCVSSPEETNVAVLHENKNNGISKNTEVHELISTNANKTKTLICLDYRNTNDFAEHGYSDTNFTTENESKFHESPDISNDINSNSTTSKLATDSFILKLLSDSYLSHLLYGLEMKTIGKIIENSLSQLPTYDYSLKPNTLGDIEVEKMFLNRLHDIIKGERLKLESTPMRMNRSQHASVPSSRKLTLLDSSVENSEDKAVNKLNLNQKNTIFPTQKISDILADSSFWKNGDSSLLGSQNDHQYECLNYDPIYEEISEDPPPLPINPPPLKNDNVDKHYKPMFLGATKYDILSFLVDAKDRIIVPEESYTFKFLRRSTENSAESENLPDSNGKFISIARDGLRKSNACKTQADKSITSIERNDSGVGSETSKTSRTKYQPGTIESNIIPPIHLCEDCGNILVTIINLNTVTDQLMLRNGTNV